MHRVMVVLLVAASFALGACRPHAGESRAPAAPSGHDWCAYDPAPECQRPPRLRTRGGRHMRGCLREAGVSTSTAARSRAPGRCGCGTLAVSRRPPDTPYGSRAPDERGSRSTTSGSAPRSQSVRRAMLLRGASYAHSSRGVTRGTPRGTRTRRGGLGKNRRVETCT